MGKKITRLHDFVLRLQQEIMLHHELSAVEKEFLWNLAILVDSAGYSIVPNYFFSEKLMINERKLFRILSDLQTKGFIIKPGNRWFYSNGVLTSSCLKNYRYIGNDINIVLSKFNIDIDKSTLNEKSIENVAINVTRDKTNDEKDFFILLKSYKESDYKDQGVYLQLQSFVHELCGIAARRIYRQTNNNVESKDLYGYMWEILKKNSDKLPGEYTQARQYLVKATATNFISNNLNNLNTSIDTMFDSELNNVEKITFAGKYEPDLQDIYTKYLPIIDMFYVKHGIEYCYTAKAILLCADIANNNHISYQKSAVNTLETTMYGFTLTGLNALMNLTCRRRGKSIVLTPNEINKYTQIVCENYKVKNHSCICKEKIPLAG